MKNYGYKKCVYSVIDFILTKNNINIPHSFIKTLEDMELPEQKGITIAGQILALLKFMPDSFITAYVLRNRSPCDNFMSANWDICLKECNSFIKETDNKDYILWGEQYKELLEIIKKKKIELYVPHTGPDINGFVMSSCNQEQNVMVDFDLGSLWGVFNGKEKWHTCILKNKKDNCVELLDCDYNFNKNKKTGESFFADWNKLISCTSTLIIVNRGVL
ncbi:MAG: hypothetical protein AABY32_05010 [Nanoarchaeota archaeon]